MLFNSISFLLFFPLVSFFYYLLPNNKCRTWFLLLASFYFYMCWKPIYAILLFVSILITYFGGMLIAKANGRKNKKRWLSLSVILLSLLLIYYKYFNFLAQSIADLLNVMGMNLKIEGWDILLPLGISFFLFKSISYLIDIYRGKIEVENDFHLLALYVSFFPQLIAGPIEKAERLIPQFKKKVEFDGRNVSLGLKMMLWGYFMKLVFANRACIYVDAVYGNLHQHNGTSILLAAIIYSFQIYCDFAGYSLLSIGCAKVMGYNVMDNFKRPYFAASISEFWKRWHISLTKWLTEYIYISLGGNRCTKLRQYRNIMMTFLVSGLWHGAAWNFIIWGGIHGVVQIVEKHFGFAKVEKPLLVKAFRILFTFFVVTLAWIFFRMEDFSEALYAIKMIFTSVGKPFVTGDATRAIEFTALAFLLIFGKEVLDEFAPNNFKMFENNNIVVRYVSYTARVILLLLTGVFDDSQFIYSQF